MSEKPKPRIVPEHIPGFNPNLERDIASRPVPPVSPERLDEETERLIQDVHCRRPQALNKLRSRIRALLASARQEGFDDCRSRLTYD